MSLLNDVLRDLERREAAPYATPTATATPRSLPGTGRVIAGALLAASILGVAIWFVLEPTPQARAGPSPAASPVGEHDEPSIGGPSDAETPESSPADDSIANEAITAPDSAMQIASVEKESERAQKPDPETLHRPNLPSAIAGVEPENTGDGVSDGIPDPSLRIEAQPRSAPSEATGKAVDKPAQIMIERVSDPDSSPLRRARRALGQNRPERATTLLLDEIDSGHADADAYLLLADIYNRQGRIDAAIAVLGSARQHLENEDRFILKQAQILLADRRPAAAAALLADEPPAEDRVGHQLVWAAALRRLERDDEALARYDAVIAVDPAHAQAWLGRGLTLETLGRHAEARSAYLKAEQYGDVETRRFAGWRRSALAAAASESELQEN